jgi:hypothetical protein
MARAFRPRGDRHVAVLDATERAVVGGLMEQTRDILAPEVEPTGDVFADLAASMGVSLAPGDQSPDDDSPESDAGGPAPRDPALDRLLPTAHRGDDQVAAEFRRLTEEGLRQRKSGNLDVAMRALAEARDDRVSLDTGSAPAFLMALTDVRLLLGERMGMRTEEDAERLHAAMATIGDDDPLGYAMAWYDFLTWLQESLTQSLMGEAPVEGDDADDADADYDDDSDEAPDDPDGTRPGVGGVS